MTVRCDEANRYGLSYRDVEELHRVSFPDIQLTYIADDRRVMLCRLGWGR
jgi:hypothetical protein